MKQSLPAWVWILLAASAPSRGQSTNGVVFGLLTDAETQRNVAGATVSCRNLATNEQIHSRANDGRFALLSVPAGFYSVTFEAPGYQAKELRSLEVPVAGQISLNVSLTLQAHVLSRGNGLNQGPLAPENGFLLGEFGLDLKASTAAFVSTSPQLLPLHAALSYVIDPQQLDQLPLQTRNVYSMLITAPSVKYEESTGRGLGISANGQRPSSSNYLLDGLENNDHLLTGPLSPLPPEGIGEYRVATSNFSAEFGSTGGFVANAISRSGSNSFHGELYGYFSNPVLNAGTFVHNSFGLDLQPHQSFEGYSLGGPILRDRLLFASSYERSHIGGRTDPVSETVPVLQRIKDCAALTGRDYGSSIELLQRFPLQNFAIPPLAAGTSGCQDDTGLFATAQVERPVAFNRDIALDRVDYRSAEGGHRLMGRISYSRITQKDFVYSPFEDFNGDLARPAYNLAAAYTRTFRPSLVNELRFGWRDNSLSIGNPHPEVPVFQVNGEQSTFLPGDNFTPIAVPESDWEINNGLALKSGRHIISAGGGILVRRIRYLYAQEQNPIVLFNTESNFVQGTPFRIVTALNRAGNFPFPNITSLDPPPFEHTVSNNQFNVFVQESFRATSRLVLNFGFRYESFGAFTNTSTQDYSVQLKPGSSAADLVLDNSKHQSPFRPDRNNAAGRLGVAYNLRGGSTVLRAGYGIFYDRPFDNLFLTPTNNAVEGVFCLNPRCSSAPFNYAQTFGTPSLVVSLLRRIGLNPNVSQPHDPLVWIDSNLRTPYIQSWFGGVQQQISRNLYIELSHMGSEGRKLITSDLVNRDLRINRDLGTTILHRSNSGSSTFAAFAAVARYHLRQGQFQASYTWSHSIDNQSEPMLGDPFNLNYTNPDVAATKSVISTFTRQFDSRADRGNSDFDIRHNLVFYSIWNMPRLFRGTWARTVTEGWRVAQLGEFRTGLPYTVFVPYARDGLYQNRANLLPGVDPMLARPVPVPSGESRLNRRAFGVPDAGQIGSLGRNSLFGPGFWNFDLSLSRTFDLAWLGEAGKLEVRGDAFSVLNHANLGNPVNTILPPPGTPSDFGVAQFGAVYPFTIFPPVTALSPTARRIQIQLKLRF